MLDLREQGHGALFDFVSLCAGTVCFCITKPMRTLRFIISFVLVAASPVAPASDAVGASINSEHRGEHVATDQDALNDYRARLRTITAEIPAAWRVRFVPSASVPAPTIEALRDLSRDLDIFLGNFPGGQPGAERIFKRWTVLCRDVFTLRVMLEWQVFAPAWSEFKRIENRLIQLADKIGPEHVARAFTDLADPVIRLWITSHSDEILDWVARLEANWLLKNQNALPSWWLRVRCDYAFGLGGRDSKPEVREIEAAEDLEGEMEISPTSPNASWPGQGESNELAPNYTATITVTVIEEEVRRTPNSPAQIYEITPPDRRTTPEIP